MGRSAPGVTSFLLVVPSQHPSFTAQGNGADKSGDMGIPLWEARLAIAHPRYHLCQLSPKCLPWATRKECKRMGRL